jgi:hypothetical protein
MKTGRQVMAIPIQPQPSGVSSSTTILKAANIKTEFGSPQQATIIQRGGQIMGSPVMVSLKFE